MVEARGSAMNGNGIQIKGLTAFKGMQFIIPAYQRGYRWGEDEIKKLVDDLIEFESSGNTDCYCLQPIVVQLTEEGQWILIDGQQRLTTAYIITCLASRKDSDILCEFGISHETRQGTTAFLNGLRQVSDETISHDTAVHPDVYYMENAKNILETYLIKRNVRITRIYNILEEKTRFIWYEIGKNANAIELFQKLNVGKIPLTDAELIKAILLNKSNFTLLPELEASLSQIKKDEEIGKMQQAIVNQWDAIEQALDDESFWNFIADDKSLHTSPRIELILRSVAIDLNKELPEGSQVNQDTKHFSFFVFFNCFTVQKPLVDEIWRRIKRKFSMFREWFENDEWYHLIGYLIRSGTRTPSKLAEELDKKNKNEITDELKKAAKSSIGKWINIDYAIDNIDYEKSENRGRIKNFLLLFNILSVMGKDGIRFPFDKYVAQKWDIEHIHAQADETTEIEDGDSILNLALLDKKTNIEYSNKPFNEKRLAIRERVREGRFVPLCTQNVFFKVYTDDLSEQEKINQWNEVDRLDYGMAIYRVFDEYFKEESNS
jgi:hypothetical protein